MRTTEIWTERWTVIMRRLIMPKQGDIIEYWYVGSNYVEHFRCRRLTNEWFVEREVRGQWRTDSRAPRLFAPGYDCYTTELAAWQALGAQLRKQHTELRSQLREVEKNQVMVENKLAELEAASDATSQNKS